MKLFCLWCLLVAAVLNPVRTQDQGGSQFYAPQTYRNQLSSYQSLFTPTAQRAVQREPAPIVEPWRSAPTLSKAQSAAILHHKQALTADGNFRYEFSADNGVAAGEVIAPDGTRTGAFQYRDPSGKLVKLKYRAGKEGFQILEGSHVPRSVEPAALPQPDGHYQQAPNQRQPSSQRQEYNQQSQSSASPSPGGQRLYTRTAYSAPAAAGNQYFVQNWAGRGEEEDDGQYRENDVEDQGLGQSGSRAQAVQKPHTFGPGYAFEFVG